MPCTYGRQRELHRSKRRLSRRHLIISQKLANLQDPPILLHIPIITPSTSSLLLIPLRLPSNLIEKSTKNLWNTFDMLLHHPIYSPSSSIYRILICRLLIFNLCYDSPSLNSSIYRVHLPLSTVSPSIAAKFLFFFGTGSIYLKKFRQIIFSLYLFPPQIRHINGVVKMAQNY